MKAEAIDNGNTQPSPVAALNASSSLAAAQSTPIVPADLTDTLINGLGESAAQQRIWEAVSLDSPTMQTVLLLLEDGGSGSRQPLSHQNAQSIR